MGRNHLPSRDRSHLVCHSESCSFQSAWCVTGNCLPMSGRDLKFLIKFAFIRLWKTTGGLFRCTRFPSSAGKCISLVFSSQSPSCTAFTVPWSGLSNEWRWSWQLHSNWSYTTRRRIQREREELST